MPHAKPLAAILYPRIPAIRDRGDQRMKGERHHFAINCLRYDITEMGRWPAPHEPEGFPARSSHACIVFPPWPRRAVGMAPISRQLIFSAAINRSGSATSRQPPARPAGGASRLL
jgi:hypothetical protein